MRNTYSNICTDLWNEKSGKNGTEIFQNDDEKRVPFVRFRGISTGSLSSFSILPIVSWMQTNEFG